MIMAILYRQSRSTCYIRASLLSQIETCMEGSQVMPSIASPIERRSSQFSLEESTQDDTVLIIGPIFRRKDYVSRLMRLFGI